MSQGSLPLLTLSNFAYWYDALEIHARTIDAQDQLTQTIPQDIDPDQRQTHHKKQDQLRKAIMQSLIGGVVKLLPQHVLIYDPHGICTILKQAVDTSSIENHELLDAEAGNLQYKAGQELKEYINGHRDIRYRMQVSRYPNIDSERTTVRYMVQRLAHHPYMHALAIMFACNPPNTIREFTNHIQQAQLIQAQAPTPQPSTTPHPKWENFSEGRRSQCTTKTRTTQRQYDKPQRYNGTWCYIHGSVTHSTENASHVGITQRYAKHTRTQPQRPMTTTTTEEQNPVK